ncbi:hypothetical protein ACRXB1_06770, partial [Caballeronia sp. M23-90]
MSSPKSLIPDSTEHWTTALSSLVRSGKTGLANVSTREAVAAFFKAQSNFDIRKSLINEALRRDETLVKVDRTIRPAVIDHLKTLQRIQAIAPSAKAASVLIKSKLTSAWHIAEMGESTFVKAYGEKLGENVARQIHTNAVNVRLRNEHLLMAAHDAAKGSGIALLDGTTTSASRSAAVSEILKSRGAPFDISDLFGAADLCECDDCNSVFSRAAYFVELLQYLRNNNLDSETPNPNTGKKGYAGTPLEQLFRRRPDLACLELTCENTFTALPYVDIVNEVMEGYVVDLANYAVTKQAKLEAFNVEGEPSEELLAQPQHVNYTAYCTLKNAVYPFSLPYHQPIDTTRVLLGFMKTSREELLRCFATDIETPPPSLSTSSAAALQDLHREARRRAVQAEALGMTQEDYIILNREAFWPKKYFVLVKGASISQKSYEQQIGVKPIEAYYGYATQSMMLATNPAALPRPGLTFVAQFLRSTGIEYTDLIALLRTRAINPGYPDGRALTVTDSLRESYRAMQALVGPQGDPNRFDALIVQLESASGTWPGLEAMLHPDPCHPAALRSTLKTQDLANWVKFWFERIGGLIVIETGDGPRLPVAGPIIISQPRGSRPGVPSPFGTLEIDGRVLDLRGRVVGQVMLDGQVLQTNGQPLPSSARSILTVESPANGTAIAEIVNGSLRVLGTANAPSRASARASARATNKAAVQWLPPTDSCDLNKARLIHLDGSPVTVAEYDRMQRFSRLWRRLGWSIDETDKALQGYATPAGNGPIVLPPTVATPSSPPPPAPPLAQPQGGIGFGAFTDDCSANPLPAPAPSPATQTVQPPPPLPPFILTPAMLEQFVAIQKLKSETGLELIALLAFWSDISTAGDASLYARLFLTYNVTALDPVFEPDVNGNFLSTAATITDHVPALMAALQLGAGDIALIMALRQMPDQLTLSTLSVLYRLALFARMLGVRARELPRVLAVFGDPFANAVSTREMHQKWRRMQAAGFSYQQVDFIVNPAAPPLGPARAAVLQLCKTLRDGLNAISLANPDPKVVSDATDDAVRAATGQLYDTETVNRIVGLLDGTTLYVASAQLPSTSTVLPVLAAGVNGKVSCAPIATTPPTPPMVGIQVTGILSAAETAAASSAASADASWTKAFSDIALLAPQFFDDALGAIASVVPIRTTLLAPDVVVPASATPASSDLNTAPGKRYAFLKAFMPFLRLRLSQQLVVDKMALVFDLEGDATQALLASVLTSGTPAQQAIDILLGLAGLPATAPPTLSG